MQSSAGTAVTASENEDFCEREGNIVFTQNESKKIISVTLYQETTLEGWNYTLEPITLSPLTVTSSGGEKRVEFSSIRKETINNKETGYEEYQYVECSISGNGFSTYVSSDEDGVVIVEVSTNNSYDTRTGVLVISNNHGGLLTYIINQEGTHITVNPETVFVSMEEPNTGERYSETVIINNCISRPTIAIKPFENNFPVEGHVVFGNFSYKDLVQVNSNTWKFEAYPTDWYYCEGYNVGGFLTKGYYCQGDYIISVGSQSVKVNAYCNIYL